MQRLQTYFCLTQRNFGSPSLKNCRSTRRAAYSIGLRVSGWPQAEQNIYSHSWIVSESEGSDDELDDKLGDESSANGHRHDASITKVEDWLGRQ